VTRLSTSRPVAWCRGVCRRLLSPGLRPDAADASDAGAALAPGAAEESWESAERVAAPSGPQSVLEWFGEVESSRELDPVTLFSVYSSQPFARLWYGARAAGESLRGRALERLYAHRSKAGGWGYSAGPASGSCVRRCRNS
jgi:hypothetical protein